MFITSNDALFHLWLKENFVEHQNISKFCDHDYMQIFSLLLMSLLLPPIIKYSHILAGI